MFPACEQCSTKRAASSSLNRQRGAVCRGTTDLRQLVHGAYALGERWSLNASYSFQGARHNNSHSVDLGASLRF